MFVRRLGRSAECLEREDEHDEPDVELLDEDLEHEWLPERDEGLFKQFRGDLSGSLRLEVESFLFFPLDVVEFS